MVGERVNSQGSRAKANELLLADDYYGLVQIAEDQVNGGAPRADLLRRSTERALRGTNRCAPARPKKVR